MQIITLINDWRQDGLYLTQMKISLALIKQDIQIIDIGPDIKSFDEKKAAFILKNSYKKFPAGTIHLNFIVDYKNKTSKYVIAKYKEQYFVSRDTGFLSLIFEADEPDEIYKTESFEHPFAELEFYPIIVQAVLKNKLGKLFSPAKSYTKKFLLNPAVHQTQIVAHISYIDCFGNIITDLDEELFKKNFDFKNFEIQIGNNIKNKITKISATYEDIKPGQLFAIFNSLGLLELGLRSGNLVQLLSIKKDQEIIINKVEPQEPAVGSIF